MASGGFLGKIISLPFKLLSGSTVSASDSVYPTVTARDLVSSTESQTPQTAVMGNDVDSLYNTTKKKRGTSSLVINKSNNSSGDYTGRGGL